LANKEQRHTDLQKKNLARGGQRFFLAKAATILSTLDGVKQTGIGSKTLARSALGLLGRLRPAAP
jgi:hypothetical protein